ncbi:hypothetical protein D3C76_624200 [compost metagenome]
MPELSFGSLGMPMPSGAVFSTGRPLAQRMFKPFCQTMAKSRNAVCPGACTVAEARLRASSVHVAATGSTLMAAARPFCGCLMTSAASRFSPPNSIAVALMLSTLRPSCDTGLPSRSRCPA